MFTGIIEATGVLSGREGRGPGARLAVRTSGAAFAQPLSVGESVAVHGPCLTVQALKPDGFYCDATAETLARTTLGTRPIGARVHLERALAVGDRLGGHIVTGHIDGKVRLRSREKVGDAEKLAFEFEESDLARFVARKGSVAIDGVSLTVNAATNEAFDVVIIPHTLVVTSLGELGPGDEANIEVDLLARYLARLLEVSPDGSTKDAALLEKLKTAGFL